MKRLAIFGAGGHGKVVADTAEACGWGIIEFFDDAWPLREMNGCWPVSGDCAMLLRNLPEFDGVLVAIGDNRLRDMTLEKFIQAGARVISLIHPQAYVSRHAKIGLGSVVFAGVVVNIDAKIERGAILNTACSVDHDCVLGRGVHISPGARLAGNVHVGNLSWIGMGAVIRQMIHVGNEVVVGAGAAVVHDIADSLKVAGVPARVL